MPEPEDPSDVLKKILQQGAPKTQEQEEAAHEAMEGFIISQLLDLGYVQPYHLRDFLADSESDEPRTKSVRDEKLTKSRIAHTIETLVEDVRSIEPRKLSVDPFVGSISLNPDVLRDFRTIAEAERFLVGFSRAASTAVLTYSERTASLDDARERYAGRRAEMAANFERARLLDSAIIARNEHAVEAANAGDLLNCEILEARVASDRWELEQQVLLFKLNSDIAHVNSEISGFVSHVLPDAQRAASQYLLAVQRKRRKAASARATIFFAPILGLALVGLIIDESLPPTSLLISSGIAGMMFILDKLLSNRLETRRAQAQLEELGRAISEAGTLLNEWLEREDLLKRISAMVGVALVPSFPYQLLRVN